MRGARILAAAATAVSLGACVQIPRLTPAQLDAVQTRPVDAPVDATFRAAAGVMLDRGMLITLSDRGAGLIAARGWGPEVDAAHAHHAVNAPPEVVLWVREDAPGRSLLRVQFARGGVPTPDSATVGRFADDVGRRALAAAPPGTAGVAR